MHYPLYMLTDTPSRQPFKSCGALSLQHYKKQLMQQACQSYQQRESHGSSREQGARSPAAELTSQLKLYGCRAPKVQQEAYRDAVSC